MTEAEWLACEDAGVIFEHAAARVSARKVRLALCGCSRAPEVWSFLTAPSSRTAIEVGEAFADGDANSQELALARKRANGVVRRHWRENPAYLPAIELASYVCDLDRYLLSFIDLMRARLSQLRPPAG